MRAARKLPGNLSQICATMLAASGSARQSSAAVATCSMVSHTAPHTRDAPCQSAAMTGQA